MKKITFVFSGGRKKKIECNDFESQEFFYGANFLKSKGFDVEIIEFNDQNRKILFIFSIIDKFLSKFISLPFYTRKLVTFKNIKTIFKSSDLFLINESVGCSSLPILIMLRPFKKINSNLFVMGLFSKNIKYKKFIFLHNLFIKLLVINVNRVLFLGKGEYLQAIKKYKKLSYKFEYFPWSVDDKFWCSDKKINFIEKKDILFVGNDGNRDVDLLIDIVKNMKRFNFTFVTNIAKLKNHKYDNVNFIEANWALNLISDTKLKSIYESSRITIVPLINSTQPSGQSVALQSMSLGTPVIISETEGFWDKDKFKENKHIIFVKNNVLSEWVDTIESSYYNLELLNTLSENSKKLVTKNFSIDLFNKRILELI